LRLHSRLRGEFSFLRGNMLVMITSWLLMNFSGAIPSTYYSLFILALGGTPAIIGIIEFVYFLVLAFVQFLGGYIADKHGRRWLIITFSFGLAITYLFYAFAPSWHFILVGVLLQSLFLVYQPAMAAMTADSIPPEQRGMGFSTIMFLNNIASVFSPAIAGILLIQFGLVSSLRIGYLWVAGFYLMAAVVRIKLKETLRTSSSRISIANAVAEYPKAVKEGLAVWKVLPRSMFFVFVTNALSSFTFAMFYPYLVVYATKILGIEEFHWAILMMWLSSCTLFSALPFGKLSDIIGRKKPFVISWVFLALFPLLFLIGNLQALFAGFLLFGLSNSLFVSTYQALEADLVPQELRGKEVGCNQFMTYLLMAIGGLIGGFLYQYVSQALPFMLAFLASVACTVISLFLIHEPKERQK